MTSQPTNLEKNLLAAFNAENVLTSADVARITGYKETTVMNYLPILVRKRRLWRVSRGQYSLDPHPVEVFAQQDDVLRAFRAFSFVTTRYVSQQTGLRPTTVYKTAQLLVKRGLLNRVRKGVYSATHSVVRPGDRAQNTPRSSSKVMADRHQRSV